jgi:hypothetical protein
MFTDKFSSTVSTNFERNHANVSTTFYYHAPANEVLAGYRLQDEYTFDISAKYNINPNLSINGRFRHYNAFINYKQYYTILNNGNWLPYNEPVNVQLNENFNLQNIDLFFNWIFKPGSRMVISYKQWLNDTYVLNDELNNSFTNNIIQVAKVSQAWLLNARVIWYLDYQMASKWMKPKAVDNF